MARLVRIIDKTLAAVGEGPADAHAPVDRTSRWQGPPAEGHGNLLADPQWIDASNAFSAKRPKAPVGKLGKIWDTIKNQPLASAVVAGLIILAATLIANQYIGSDDSQHRTPAGTTAAFAAPPASGRSR